MREPLIRSHAWQVSLGRLLVLLVTAGIVGLALDVLLPALVLALLGYSLASLWQLYRLQRWLTSRRRVAPPLERGVWSDVAGTIWRHTESARSRKRRLVRLLRAFREAAAALPDGVVVMTRGRSILWFNESAARLLDLRAPRDWHQLIDTHVPVAARRWLTDGTAEPLLDVPSPRVEGMRLGFRLIPYADQALLVVRDISHLMRLEQIRRDFVANVSHELRTPLTVLHGYLDLLEPTDVPQWGPMLSDLRAQSRRMAQIVEDLLTLSRMEAESGVADEVVPMAAMLATLGREAQALSQRRHGIVVRDEAHVDLRGSPKYLHSAFSNLVTNAVRYTPDGGHVEILFERDAEGGARFVVRDTGHGIPPEHLPRITERFYRVSASRSRESGGTGLGLSIVKHALHLHQARLQIESRLGEGSCFGCHFGPERVVARENLAERSA